MLEREGGRIDVTGFNGLRDLHAYRSRLPTLIILGAIAVVSTPKTKPTLRSQPRCKRVIFSKKTGAGEGIRTLDPNLGKVVLYP